MPNVTVNPLDLETPACDPPSLRIPRNLGANVPIVFQLAPGATAKWSWFSRSPIVVQAPPGLFSGGSQLNPTGKGAITVTDRNAAEDRGTFKYNVTLRKDSWPEGVFLTIDPEIVNET